jgi:peptidylprolyl isomerase
MEAAGHGDTVKVHVTGKLEGGKVFDSTANGDPLELTIGKGKFVRGLENAIVGMSPGEKKTVRVTPEEGFGSFREGLSLKVARKSISPSIEPQVGMQLTMSRGESEKTRVTITDVSESSITVDANHPLAGKNLIFDIEFLDFT